MVASQDKAWASGDATRATQDAPTTVNGEHGRADTPIAVVGMACRFAGDATTPQKLWDLCASGRDAWSGIPEERFDVKSLYHADSERPGRVRVPGMRAVEIQSVDARLGADDLENRIMLWEDTSFRRMWLCLMRASSTSHPMSRV